MQATTGTQRVADSQVRAGMSGFLFVLIRVLQPVNSGARPLFIPQPLGVWKLNENDLIILMIRLDIIK